LKDAKLKQQDINTLNQRDRVRLMKEAKRQAEFEAMKVAAAENAQNAAKARQML